MTQTFDVIVVGGGWSGSTIAAVASLAGLSVLMIERGDITGAAGTDEFFKLQVPGLPPARLQDTSRETYTLRYSMLESAFPLRKLGSFLAGQGLGGAGMSWGGISPRFHPESFTPKSRFADGLRRPDAASIDYRDWPIGYGELESHYGWFEAVAGVAPTRGLKSERYQRSRPLPGEPLDLTTKNTLLAKAAAELGLDVTETPIAVSRVPYCNPLNVTRSVDPVHGYSLATPLNTLVPAALRTGRLTIVRGRVRRIRHEGGVATGVTYTSDPSDDGEQLAQGAAIALCTWALNNVRLLLLSQVGTPYDPATATGAVGRYYANHVGIFAEGYLPRRPAQEAPGLGGWASSSLDADLPADADFVGGARIQAIGLNSLQRELPASPGVAQWGAEWKRDLRDYYGRRVLVAALGEVVPDRYRFLDLDPIYRDAWGDPLLRMTFDWGSNERRMTARVGQALQAVLAHAGAELANDATQLPIHYDTVRYTNSHATGGATMGIDPEHSVVDPELRCWDVPNLWVVGSSAFPSCPAPNPTLTVGALSHRAACAIVKHIGGKSPA